TDIEARGIGPVGTSQVVKNGKSNRGSGGDSYFLTLFGKPARVANCDCERSADPTLLQTLFTRNDPSLLQRIDGSGNKDSSYIAQLRAVTKQRGGGKIDTDKTI